MGKRKTPLLVLGDDPRAPDHMERNKWSSLYGTYIGRRLWQGKTVLLDLDGTLIKSEEVGKETDMESRWGRGNKSHVITSNDNGERYGFEITGFSKNAKRFLRMIREWGARAFITSAADDRYVEGVARISGFSEVVDGIFGWERMVHLMGKRWGVSPKDFRGVLSEINEHDPLKNCVVIGNDLLSDVPVNPKGMVAMIGSDMDRLFYPGYLHLHFTLFERDGHFSNGFDRIFEENPNRYSARFIRTDNWTFDKRTSGFARVIRMVPSMGLADGNAQGGVPAKSDDTNY